MKITKRRLCEKPTQFLAVLLLATPGWAATHYVDLNSPAPAAPYASWANAADNIQDAVDVAGPGDLILVTNGVYRSGARAVCGMSNRVAVTKPLRVQSVNGPAVTTIVGYKDPVTTNGAAAVRCVYLTNGAVLAGFTLTNGATQTSGDYNTNQSGGGVCCESTSCFVSNCVLTGNSASAYAGGTYLGTLNNCTLSSNSASAGGGAINATLNNCTLMGNSAKDSGGGARYSTLNNCTLSGNSVGGGGTYQSYGGGASESTLNNSVLVGNSATGPNTEGGGAFYSTLNNCTLIGNSANQDGGGAGYATLNNCVLTGNSAFRGGGVSRGTLNNCTLTGNSAWQAGGTFWGTLNNCVVYYNTSRFHGDNYDGNPTLNYCSTTPLPRSGTGNLAAEPQLASASHLSAGSPCRGAGSAAYASGLDLDGEPWANPPSIGCDEYWSGSVTGALSAAIVVSYTNVAVGFAVDFQAVIGGRVSASRWDFGDGTVVSNRPYASHAWTNAGVYSVELRAYNESSPGGVAANVTLHVVPPPVHYVAADSLNPLPPYATWATAATSIQDAVDAADTPGALVSVTNGVYQAGATAVDGISNRVVVTKPVRVQSVNGPLATTILGYQVPGTTNGVAAVRCVYLANRALLAGFTLSHGAASSGGGAWCESPREVVSNCVLIGNAAYEGGGAYLGTLDNCTLTFNSAVYNGGGASGATLINCTLSANSAHDGGGANSGALNNCLLKRNSAVRFGGGALACTLNNCTLTDNSASAEGGGALACTLNNCVLTGNSAQTGGGAVDGTLNNCTLTGNSADGGGGAYHGTLNNCTLMDNSAWYGGGAQSATLNNCIVYYNTASNGPNYDASAFNNSCTTPLPPYGIGNITNAPLFADQAGGNLRLQSNSPCINAGNNAYAPGATDPDGNPRIAGGTVDIGAYEFQTPTSIISYAWLQYYLLPTDGSADYADPDGDGMNNWQEWVAASDPIDPASLLRLLAPSFAGTGATLTWLSAAGRSYTLERATNLSPTATFSVLQSNIVGLPGKTSWTDTNVMGSGPRFYRVGVEN